MRTLATLLSFLIILPAAGTLGFWVIEGWSFLDSLYMAIITLSTVGYEVVEPISDAGKVFIIIYIITSLSIVIYSLTKIGEMAVGGELKSILRRRLINQKINALHEHYIVCGAGRMGAAICSQLEKAKEPFIVIDKDPEKIDQARERGWISLEGDATSDEVLKEAQLQTALCITTVLPNDSDNLFTVMSARLLNHSLKIISRANDESAINKLKRAGANRIVNPYSTGAVKISQLMINPQLEEFIEILGDKELGIDLTITHVERASKLEGKTLEDLRFTDQGIIVIAIRGKNGKILLPPPKNYVLNASDSLVTVGTTESLQSALDIKS